MTNAIEAYMRFELATRRAEERRRLERGRIERAALRKEIETIARLISMLKLGKLEEAASTPEQAARRRERDLGRQARVRATLASADRRVAALKAQRAVGKPTGPMGPDKARREAERLRKLDRREKDIRASANASAAATISKLGR